MDGLNKINRRQFFSRLLRLGAAIALPRLVFARHEVSELPVPLPASVVVPPVLADEEPDEAMCPDIARGVNSANWTEEERQQKQFKALQIMQKTIQLKKHQMLKIFFIKRNK